MEPLLLPSEEGGIVDECRVKTREAMKSRFEELKLAVIAIEVGTHSRWVSQNPSEYGHEVIVANARELRAIIACNRSATLRARWESCEASIQVFV